MRPRGAMRKLNDSPKLHWLVQNYNATYIKCVCGLSAPFPTHLTRFKKGAFIVEWFRQHLNPIHSFRYKLKRGAALAKQDNLSSVDAEGQVSEHLPGRNASTDT